MKFQIAALALLFSVASSPALAADETLTVKNRTGYTISEVYISPARSDNWEEDVLGQDTLTEGANVDIDFSRSEDVCKWDLKAVYEEDDSSAVWRNIDLCSISEISLFYNAETNVTSARWK